MVITFFIAPQTIISICLHYKSILILKEKKVVEIRGGSKNTLWYYILFLDSKYYLLGILKSMFWGTIKDIIREYLTDY